MLFTRSSSEESCFYNDKLDFDLAKRFSQSLVEYSVVGEEGSSCICQGTSWMRVVSCRRPLPWHIPRTGSAKPCDPRLPSEVSTQNKSYILYFCKTSGHSSGTMPPFSRALVPLRSLHRVVSTSRRSCTRFIPKYSWRAIKVLVCRQATPPCTLFWRLGWPDSTHSLLWAELPPGPPTVLVGQHFYSSAPSYSFDQ